VSTRSHGEEVAASEMTKACYSRPDRREVRAWDDRGCLQRRRNVGNDASGWRKAEREEGLVYSSHGAAAGWGRVHGAQIVGSGPKAKMQDREVVVEEGRRKS